MANNPFTLLREVVDPIMQTTSADASVFNDPFLNLFNFEDYQGMQPDSAGKIDIWKVTSMPAINIGDYWQYTSGSKKTTTGSLKCKKMTISVGLSEDELDRITKLGANNSIIAKELINLQKDTFDYLKQTLHLWITDPWGGVTTGEDYDASYVGALAASSTGTISNPSSPVEAVAVIFIKKIPKLLNECDIGNPDLVSFVPSSQSTVIFPCFSVFQSILPSIVRTGSLHFKSFT